MPGGRPSEGRQQRRAWLEELATWFDDGVTASGKSRLAFSQQHGLDYKVLCRIANAERLPTEDAIRYIAAAFGRTWLSVEPIWKRADHGEREAQRRRVEKTIAPVTSWSELPALTSELEELLDAQCEASDSLPYKLLGVNQPKLSEIYVQQHVRLRNLHSDHDTRSTGDYDRNDHLGATSELEQQPEEPISLTDALTRHEHLVITGDPGAGKSTLASMYARKIARCWLGTDSSDPPIVEPALPVKISAQQLTGEDAWAELLATGVQKQLRRLLSRRPSPDLFSTRAFGARWMVFIDGVDEIVDTETRIHVLQAIARQIRRGDIYRIIVTARPLPGNQLQLLAHANLGTYSIKPFSPDELDEFAMAWFRAQDPVTAKGRARNFVAQVRDQRLKPIVRNPLLATVAAIVNTKEPDRPLPSNRVGLYERFVSYLLDETSSGRNTLGSIVDSEDSDPGRAEFARCIIERLPDIASYLAVQRLEGISELNDAAQEWVLREVGSQKTEYWQDDLAELLLAFGIFVRDGDGVRFLHHSLAEFLAARTYATKIGEDFTELDSWIDRAFEGPKEQFVLFTFAQWSRQPSHEASYVLNRLLAGGKDWLTLAGKLAAEVSELEEGLGNRLGERLINALLAVESPTEELIDSCRSLAGWQNSAVNEQLGTRLRALLNHPALQASKRLLLAIALGYVAGGAEASRWLERMANEVRPNSINLLVAGWADLVADGASKAEVALSARAASVQQPPAFYAFAADALLDAGKKDAALGMLRVLLDQPEDEPNNTGSLVEELCGDKMTAWRKRPDDCSEVARLAGQLGQREECVRWAWTAIRTASCTPSDVRVATQALLHADRGQAREILSTATELSIEHKSAVATVLRDAGETELAAKLAWTVVHDGWQGDPWAVRSAISLVVTEQPASTSEVLNVLAGWPLLSAYHAALVAEVLEKAGQAEHAQRMAYQVIRDSRSDRWDSCRATEVLLRTDCSVDDVVSVATDLAVEQACGVAEALCKRGHVAAAVGLMDEKLGYWNLNRILVLSTIGIFVKAGAYDFAKRAMHKLRHWRYNGLWDCAEFCSASLQMQENIDVGAVVGPRLSDRYIPEMPLKQLVEAWCRYRQDSASAEIQEMLATYGVKPDAHIIIGDALAERGLLSDATKAWMRVLGNVTATEQQSVAVAVKLASCGQLDPLIGRLRDLTGKQNVLTESARTARALLGWVEALHDSNSTECSHIAEQ